VKVSIEGREYELTDECITDLLKQMRTVLTKTNVKLPSDIQTALDGINSLTDESLLLFVQSIRDYGLGYYQGLSTPKRLSVMAGVRWIISQGERRFGEVARAFRPPKRADPLEHLVSVVMPSVEKTVPVVGKVLPYVSIALTTDNENITHVRFSIEGQGGGQVAVDGNVREWQDNGGETVEQVHSAALS